MRSLVGKIVGGLVSALRHPRPLVEISVILLVAVIWFRGQWIGLETVESRVQVMLLISALRVCTYVVQHWLDQRRARQLEQSLDREAQAQLARARPDRQEEIRAAQTQFEKGIAALKASKLGRGVSGKAALYALPWYMFIGPPGAGKSTALRHSGLVFPYLGGSGQGLQGVGGTRNCDWWFTSQAVLLDTAGRYVTHDEDQAEWLAFLDLLRKYRSHTPINGVIAAISIADLMQAHDDELETHAKMIRTRIDELIMRLGVVFPVYVMFTKCDLVQGFVEFFEDLSRGERERVWGCTFPKSDMKEAPDIRLSHGLSELIDILKSRRLTRLTSTHGSPHKLSIYSFPLQLQSIQGRLARFIELLFQANPYQENPMFRGFYLTSGTQEGTPIDRILASVGRASGLSDMAIAGFTSSHPKSYFLKELFTDIIFPDSVLAAPSSGMERQRGRLRIATSAVAVVFLLSSIAGLIVSFLGNRHLLSAASAAGLPRPAMGQEPRQLEQNMERVDGLGQRLAQILRFEEHGVPLRLWGFYEGRQIQEPMQELYIRYFGNVLLKPTKRDMEERLARFVLADGDGWDASGTEEVYSTLKAYIMIGNPSHLEPEYLRSWLGQYWNHKVSALYGGQAVLPEVREAVERQMTLYSRYLAREEAGHLVLNGRLVQEVQGKLARVPRVQRLYALTLGLAEDQTKPFTLESILHGGQQGALTSDVTIPGVFTAEGWRGPFQASATKVLEESGEEGWVIGEPEVNRKSLDQDLKDVYLADYVRYWLQFMKSLRVKAVVTPANVEEMLAVMGQPDSPMVRALEAIDRNTTLAPDAIGSLHETATGLLAKMKQGLGLPAAAKEAHTDTEEFMRRLGDPNDFSRTVAGRFKSVHHLVAPAREAKEEPPLSRYVSEIRKVHQALRPILRGESPANDTKQLAKSIVGGEPNDLLQAIKTTDLMLGSLDPHMREALSGLLIEPWIVSMKAVLERAKVDTARRWAGQVFPVCQRTIESHYPFQGTGTDAAYTDVVDFFHPDNGLLWRFYQSDLSPFVDDRLETWTPRAWYGVAMTFSEDFLANLHSARVLTDSLFVKGAADLSVSFELYPYPPQGPASKSINEVLLEIGGQPLQYRNDLQEWHDMKWPGPNPGQGASLQVHLGTAWVPKEFKNPWGFFRLIEAGKLVPQRSDLEYRVQWDLESPEAKHILIQYDLKAKSANNPFRPGIFQQFRCLDHL